MIPEETDLTSKHEISSTSHDHHNAKNFNKSSTSSWTRLKDPRIVRVSRAFGGKDRHSKVCTVRGLRDRRVRLSVPTAIQLYDLQDRLGLNQPSKVVDWLLNAAKDEIDELPPLQIPQGTFSQHNLDAMLTTSHSLSNKQGLNIGGSSAINWSRWGKSSDVSGDETNWVRSDQDQERHFMNMDHHQNQGCSYPSSLNNPNLVNNSIPYVRWDPANLSLSQPPRSHGLTSQQDQDWHNFSLVPMQHQIPSHQVLVYHQPPGLNTQPYFPFNMNTEFDPKQSDSPVESTPQSIRPIHFNMTANVLPSQNNHGS